MRLIPGQIPHRLLSALNNLSAKKNVSAIKVCNSEVALKMMETENLFHCFEAEPATLIQQRPSLLDPN
jgi:hypothetical protein